MTAIRVLSETDETVTLSRQDFEALLDEAQLQDDVRIVEERRALAKKRGIARVRRDYLTADEMQRLLDGASSVRVWREKRGVPQNALAAAIGTVPSYLAAVESGTKPGSTDLYRRVAAFLDVQLEHLLPIDRLEPTPLDRAEQAATRLIRKAESQATTDEMGAEAKAIVAEWLAVAARDGVPEQVKGTLWQLRRLLTAAKSPQPGIEAAIDIIGGEARRL